VDEATLAFYRGYRTAALALLFIVAEDCLRNLLGWQPGDPKVSFSQLKNAVLILPASDNRNVAHELLSTIYAFYDAADPPVFLFNRHGLMHGLRGAALDLDKMNCARAYVLLDHIALASTRGYRSVILDENFAKRHELFERCVSLGSEQRLLRLGRPNIPIERNASNAGPA
jgi:hypothetical protein